MALSSSKTREQANQGRPVGVLRVPQGYDILKIDKAGTYKLAILPYTVPAGAKHPVVKDGEMHYTRDYYVHNGLGTSGKGQAVCPKSTRGERCPICEGIKAGIDSGQLTKEIAKDMYAKQRSLFTLWLPEVQNKVVLFDHSYHGFAKQLNTTISAKVAIPGREWLDYFADPVEGAFMWVTFAEKPLPGNRKFFEAVSFEFEKHGGIPQLILDQALQLDKCFHVESYDALHQLFDQESTVDTTPPADEAPVAGVKPATSQTAPTQPAVVVTTTPAPEPKIQRPAVVTTAAPTPQVAAPAKAGPAKGDTLYHRELGAVTFVKNVNGSVTVLDAADEPVKAKEADLRDTPWPEAKAAATSATNEPEPVPASAGKGDDEEWDADWSEGE